MSSLSLERVTTATPARTGQRLSLRRLALAAALLAMAAGGTWYARDWWTTGRFIESTDDAYVGGNVTALAPHIDAFVARILVADNERVRAGQVLIELDPRDYQAALDHAAAALAARQAAAESLRAQYALQQATIRQLRSDLAAKEAQAIFATEDAVRYRALAATSYGSRQNEQRATAAERASHASVDAAQAALQATQEKLKVLAADIAEADAATAQAQSDLATARLNLGYCEIRSPIDGYVGNRAAEIGAYATRGTYLISVAPAHGLWVDANFKEDQLARMEAGEQARVTADVLPGHVFLGHVASLAPGTGAVFSVIPPENATGNFTKIVQRVPVRILLDAGDGELKLLRPGLSTTVRVDTRDAGGRS